MSGEISYVGIDGMTDSCLDGLRRLVQCSTSIRHARLVSHGSGSNGPPTMANTTGLLARLHRRCHTQENRPCNEHVTPTSLTTCSM